MKKSRWIAVLLAVVQMIVPAAGVNAGAVELTYYTDGSKLSYDPLTQGYYGYMNVQYPDMTTGETTNDSFLVLVKDGHTLVEFHEISEKLNISFDWNNGNPIMQVFRREIQFKKGSADVVYRFSHKEIKLQMNTAAVYQDGNLWVPFEWYLLLADVSCNMVVQEDGTVYAELQAPEETVLDVLIGIYEDTRLFEYTSDFNIGEEILQQRNIGSKIVDITDGIMRLEWDKWLSIFPNILDKAYAKDVMELILAASPDEALQILQDDDVLSDGTKQMIDLFGDDIVGNVGTGLVQFGSYLQECADQEIGKRIKEYAEGSESWKAMRNALQDRTMTAYLYKDAGSNLIYSSKGKELILNGNEVKINGNSVKVTAADHANALIDLVTFAADAVESVNSFENRDQYAVQGARAMLNRLETQESVLQEHCQEAFKEAVSKYESEAGLATNWFLENVGTLVMNTAEDVVLALADTVVSPFTVYKMGCAAGDWITEKLGKETFSTKLNGTEAFQLSLIAMQYQQDSYAMYRMFYQDWLNSMDSTYGFDEEKTEDILCQAYHYLKTCYVTRGLALDSAWQHKDTPAYKKQRNLQEEELLQESMILSYDTEELLPTEKLWLVQQSDYSDEHLALYVTPAYLHITGSVYDIVEEAPVTTAGIKIYDGKDALLNTAVVDESGTFDLYLPIEVQEELRGSWNPTPTYSEALKLTCTTKDGDEITMEVPQAMMVELRELSAKKTLRELTADVGVIEVGEVIHPYYQFIKDELLPEWGFADLEVLEETMTVDAGGSPVFDSGDSWWNKRTGLLSADITDIDHDGTEDLLVYYFGEFQADYLGFWEKQNAAEESYYYGNYGDGYTGELCPNCLLVDVYSMDEEGEVYALTQSSQLLYCTLPGYQEYAGGGILKLDGKAYLYVESFSDAYGNGGFDVSYNIYDLENGALVPKWSICKTDGDNVDYNYSLFTRGQNQLYKKQVLFYDNEMDVKQVRRYLNLGFAEIGMEESSYGYGKESYYVSGAFAEFPIYVKEDYMVPSFRYSCAGKYGEDSDTGRNMESAAEDYTKLREYIAALGVDYYTYIAEELLPVYGFASTEPASEQVTSMSIQEGKCGWDDRAGILGADVVDMDGDQEEELLVYRLAQEESGQPGDYAVGLYYPTVMYVDLYVTNDAGEIEKMDSVALFRDSNVSFLECNAGWKTLENGSGFFVELISSWAIGGANYTYKGAMLTLSDEGKLDPVWSITKRSIDDGTGGSSYYVLTQGATERILWLSDYQYQLLTENEVLYPYAGTSYEAIQLALVDLGFSRTERSLASEGNAIFASCNVAPMYGGTSVLQDSWSYLCHPTEGTNAEIEVSVEDLTGMRAKLEEVEGAK